MATLKQRLHRKNADGSYDTIYLECDLSNVTGTLSVTNGGTGQTNVSGIKTALSLPSDTSTEINNLKTSVSSGKAAVASAITDKGVSTSATAEFSVMASNIRSITTGLECFIVITTTNGNGSTVKAVKGSTTLTGTISNNTCTLKVPSKGNWTVTITSPTYPSQTKTITVGDGNVAFTMCPQWVLNLKSAAVGSTITLDGYEWIVVHKTSTAATLGLHYWYADTKFGSNTTYKGSTIASLAATFESNTLSAATKTFLNNVTVNGVTAKVFIPSYEQFNGGFSYYDSNASRIFTNSKGSAQYAWTSSAYSTSYARYVLQNGLISFTNGNPANTYGFRPHIEVMLP